MISQANKDFEKKGVSLHELEADIANIEEPWDERTQQKVRRQLQRRVKERLADNARWRAEARVRAKMKRWKLEELEGYRMAPGRVAMPSAVGRPAAGRSCARVPGPCGAGTLGGPLSAWPRTKSGDRKFT